jgi:cbb3-type cytochrome oxidase maturation protein
MSIIYILIPIAVLLTALGIYLFFWAVKTEQFDDLEKQGMSILFDENEKSNNPKDVKLEIKKESDKTQTSINGSFKK